MLIHSKKQIWTIIKGKLGEETKQVRHKYNNDELPKCTNPEFQLINIYTWDDNLNSRIFDTLPSSFTG